jgi:hypothetical protein
VSSRADGRSVSDASSELVEVAGAFLDALTLERGFFRAELTAALGRALGPTPLFFLAMFARSEGGFGVGFAVDPSIPALDPPAAVRAAAIAALDALRAHDPRFAPAAFTLHFAHGGEPPSATTLPAR